MAAVYTGKSASRQQSAQLPIERRGKAWTDGTFASLYTKRNLWATEIGRVNFPSGRCEKFELVDFVESSFEGKCISEPQ
jgi:hypothetical protein